MASCLLMSPRRILGDLALTRRSGSNYRWTAEGIAISAAPLATGIFKPGIGQSVHVSLKLQNSPISPCTTLVCELESRRCFVGMLPTPPGTPLAARMRYHRPPPHQPHPVRNSSSPFNRLLCPPNEHDASPWKGNYDGTYGASNQHLPLNKSNVRISTRTTTRKINLAMKLAASSRASAMIWCRISGLSRMLLRIICSKTRMNEG